MRKRTSVAFLALMGLLLFGCGKKTSEDKPTTTKKTTPTTQTTAKPTTSKKQVKKFTISVVNSIQNAGTVSGTGEVEEGKSTTLKATAADGYTFLGFFDGETEITKDSEYTITVTKDVNLTAKWMAKTYTLAVKKFSNVDPDDIVEIDDDSLGTVEYEVKELYSTGEEITLTATPAEGYQFNGWWLVDPQEGDHLISAETEYKFSMLPQNSTIKALFGTKKCVVEIIANNTEAIDEISIYDQDLDEGHKFGPDMAATVTFDYNEAYSISATAKAGYTFQGFYLLDENGEYDIENDELLMAPYDDYAVDFGIKYLAYFTTNNYKLTVSKSIEDAGTITIEPENEEYTFLSTITITTTVNDGFTFDGWYSSNTYSEESKLSEDASTTLTYVLTNAYDTVIYAKYTADGVQFNFEIIGSEEVEGGEIVYWGDVNESKLYDYDTTLTLKATPTNGHVFAGWYLITIDPDTQEEVETLISPYSTYDYIIDSLAPRNIRAKFVCGEYWFCGHTNITDSDFSNDDEDCPYNLIINQTDNTSYVYGSEVTLVAPTVAGFTFVGWYIAN